MSIEIINIPDLGEVEEVEVIEINVDLGQEIESEDTIIVLESDKAAMEIPASKQGKISKLLVSVGDKVSEGMPFVEIETEENAITISDENESEKLEDENTSTEEAADSVSESVTPELNTLNIPDLGEVEEVEVIEVSASINQEVGDDETIIVLESDKAAMEIPASVPGIIKKIHVKVGDKVKEGMPFIDIETTSIKPVAVPSKNQDEKTEEIIAPKTIPDKISKPQNNSVQHKPGKSHAGPAVRKLAREFGIDLKLVTPSGPKGRILKEDLHAYVSNKLNGSDQGGIKISQPDIDYSKWGDIDTKPLTKFQKTASENLHSSWVNIPHVTQHDEANISDLLGFRKKANSDHSLKISPLAYIIKITAETLKDFPEFNSSLSSNLQDLVYKKYINIGIAVDTPNGLIVPNIKNTDKLNVREISDEVFRLAKAAKDRKLKVGELKGATFTISSLSGIGGKFFTPIINPPEVGILGLSKTFEGLALENGDVKVNMILPMSLSYDHRVINGAYAAKFISKLSENLSNIDFKEIF
jgi:pyruvate dehydrogenase E2 component (dihydrolipoamide acetyltransferase)